jgi:hypothetical protein
MFPVLFLPLLAVAAVRVLRVSQELSSSSALIILTAIDTDLPNHRRNLQYILSSTEGLPGAALGKGQCLVLHVPGLEWRYSSANNRVS